MQKSILTAGKRPFIRNGKVSLGILLMGCFLPGYHVYSQTIELNTPVSVRVTEGEELSVRLNVLAIKKYTIKMINGPSASKIEANTFKWTPRNNQAGFYPVKFQLMDSSLNVVNEASLAITVDPANTTPYLLFDKSIRDTIPVTENQSFIFSASIKSRIGSNPQSMLTYFQFNEDANIRSFDSCSVNRMGDQIIFRWRPSNREALKIYAKLRITLVDVNNAVGSQILNFKIKNVNRPPKFINEPPDTVFMLANQELNLDFTAKDPDGDNLTYDYFPKSALYSLQGGKIILKIPNIPIPDASGAFPINLMVTVSDGEFTLRRNVFIVKNRQYHQPSIGEFSRKIFSEGDSLVTYLNWVNDNDPKQVDVKFKDLNITSGMGSLSSRLVYDKKASYIKVYSKGILPYYLVDKDFTFSIAVTITSKEGNWKPVFKVMEVTINDRPNPSSLSHQKDSLLLLTKTFLTTEEVYRSTLDKVKSRINRPWWKKVAVVTGTLSGILILVQSQDPNKNISTASAAISLISIMVTNLPTLSEKTLTDLNDKLSSSKSRIDRIQEKESELLITWPLDIDQTDFNKLISEIGNLLEKFQAKRNEEVCLLLKNKQIHKHIDQLIERGATNPAKLVFECQSSE